MKRAVCILALCFVMSFAFPSTAQVSRSPRIKVRNGASTNWSGYAVQTNLQTPQNDVVTDVKGQWVVPSVTCNTTNTYSSIWVGIDGYSSNSVEQTGTDSDCYNGQARYYAWYEMYPKASAQISLPIRVGDSISAEVAFTGNGRFVLTLKNLTTGGSFTTTQRSNRAARSSAEWIVEAPSSSGGVLPLANFGTANVTNAQATLNGHTGSISDSAWQNDAITMVNSSGAVKASTSSLGSGGTSFSVTWKASN